MTVATKNGRVRDLVNLDALISDVSDKATDRFLAAAATQTNAAQAEIATPVPAPVNRFALKAKADSDRRSQYLRTITKPIESWELIIDMLAFLGKDANFNLANADHAKSARRLSTSAYPDDFGGMRDNRQSLYVRLSSYIQRVLDSGKPEPKFITLSFDCDPSSAYYLNNHADYQVIYNAERLYDRYSIRPEQPHNSAERFTPKHELVTDGQFEQRCDELDDLKLIELREATEGPSTVK